MPISVFKNIQIYYIAAKILINFLMIKLMETYFFNINKK
jgi:hypothetical protein